MVLSEWSRETLSQAVPTRQCKRVGFKIPTIHVFDQKQMFHLFLLILVSLLQNIGQEGLKVVLKQAHHKILQVIVQFEVFVG